MSGSIHYRVFRCLAALILILKLGYGDTAADKLQTLMDDFWEMQMRNNPTSSTYSGMYKYNDRMESFSVARFDEDRNQTQKFLDQLMAINRHDLDDTGKVNYDILNDSLSTFLDGNTWSRYGALTPVNFLSGIQLYSGPSMAPSSTRGDFYNYIARLHAVKRQVEEIKESCRLAIKLNRTLHNVSLVRLPEQFDRKIYNNSEDSPYFSVFGDKLNNSSIQNETEREHIRSLGKQAVQVYMDAFRDLKNFIIDEYMPNTRQEYGVYVWDPTHEYYKACLKWHLSFAMHPNDVHEAGLQEVHKITTKMQQIMTKLGFQGSVRDFFASLEGDPRFYSNDTDKILAEYHHVVFERINPIIPTIFKNVPDIPLVIQASTSDGLGGGYSGATETSPGRFTINLFRPLEVPFFEMMALSLHEASPGHHLQHSYSMKANLPDFRKDPLLSFYNVPNWFPFYSAYSEGWGLYSEYLGEEMNLYKDDYEMWSREVAIEYLMNYTAMGQGSAANEIDRYISWPGQACAYKLGEIRMLELRREAEKELGSAFDIKDFHSMILENGALSMSMLESMTKDWIQKTKSSSSPTSAASIDLPVSIIQMLVFLLVIIHVI